MKNLKKDQYGFTLIELIVIILILGVLIAIAVPSYIGYIEKSRIATDSHSLGVLNDITRAYCSEEPFPNLFEIEGTSVDDLMQTLVDANLLAKKSEPRQKGLSFEWDFNKKVWLLSNKRELTSTQITMGTGGYKGFIIGSYSGTAAEIIIPNTMDGETVTQIYQDVFNGKSLTSVTFATDSTIVHIHARAFHDNGLTEIVLPSSLRRLDVRAFYGNDITKVTIGSGVTLEGHVFANDNLFRDAYNSQGAGTYIFAGGNWTKE